MSVVITPRGSVFRADLLICEEASFYCHCSLAHRQTTCCYIVSTLLWAVITRLPERAFDVIMARPPYLIPLVDWWRESGEGWLSQVRHNVLRCRVVRVRQNRPPAEI